MHGVPAQVERRLTRGVHMLSTKKAIRLATIMLSSVHGIKVTTFCVIAAVYDLEDMVVAMIRGTTVEHTNIVAHFVSEFVVGESPAVVRV